MSNLTSFTNLFNAKTTDLKISLEFHNYLNTLPWIGTTLDWTKVSEPWKRFDLDGTESSEKEISYLEQTILRTYSHVWICYDTDKPGIVVDKQTWYDKYDLFSELTSGEQIFITGFDGDAPVVTDFVEKHFWEYIVGKI